MRNVHQLSEADAPGVSGGAVARACARCGAPAREGVATRGGGARCSCGVGPAVPPLQAAIDRLYEKLKRARR